jgi:hypothetical protein
MSNLKINKMETKETLEQQLVDSEKKRLAAEQKSLELKKQIQAIEDANKPKPIEERVNDMGDILNILGADENNDIIKIDKFDNAEHLFVQNIIKKMRIVKVLNEGWLPTKGDYRYYNWYDVSSGFVFRTSAYDVTVARAASASRLCFKNSKLARFMFERFKNVEKGIILE